MNVKCSNHLEDVDKSILKFPDGTPFIVGQIISAILKGRSQSPDPLKDWSLALRFWNENEVTLDIADTAFLKEAIRTTKTFNSIVTGQLLAILES